MRPPAATLMASLVALVSLAGCVEGGDDAPVPPEAEPEACVGGGFCAADAVVDDTGRDLRTELRADDSLDAPTWEVGDVFEQHLYYGEADGAGEHIQTMVVDDSGSCYRFGTTSQTAARSEAVYDLPILGCIEKEHLKTQAFGTDWSWMYDFPLTDGKSWDGAVNGIFNWNHNTFHDYAFTLTATYAAAIDTPGGDFPGFLISGTTADGEEFLRYNYVPAVGWFSHFWMYDLSTPEDDIMFHAMSMGTSTGFTGTYYIDESETLIDEAMVLPFTIADGPPQLTFTVPEGATQLQGVVVPVACPGVSKVSIVGPDNAVEQYDHVYEGEDPATCVGGEPTGDAYTVHWIDRAAVPGEYRIVTTGAGIHGHFIWLEAVTDVAYELTATPETAE